MADPPFDELLASWPAAYIGRPVDPRDLVVRRSVPSRKKLPDSVEETKKETHVVLGGAIRPGQTDAELERLYGDGRYEERQERLHAALKRLKPTVVARVYGILSHARCAQLAARRVERGIDQTRVFFDERDLVQSTLTKWIRRALDFYAYHCGARLFDRGPFPIHIDNETVATLSLLLAKLDPTVAAQAGTAPDPLWTSPPKTPRRRAARGRPASQTSTWVRQARLELRMVGVTRAIQDELLTAVCLIPYRP